MEKTNSGNKPSPSDEKTFPEVDKGHDSVVKKEDKTYHHDDAAAKTEQPAEYYQNEEQPVESVKDAPKED